jgi:hypothetical protein
MSGFVLRSALLLSVLLHASCDRKRGIIERMLRLMFLVLYLCKPLNGRVQPPADTWKASYSFPEHQLPDPPHKPGGSQSSTSKEHWSVNVHSIGFTVTVTGLGKEFPITVQPRYNPRVVQSFSSRVSTFFGYPRAVS